MNRNTKLKFYSFLWLVYTCGESQVYMCGFGFYGVHFAGGRSLNILIAGEEILGRIAVSMGHNGFMFVILRSVCLCLEWRKVSAVKANCDVVGSCCLGLSLVWVSEWVLTPCDHIVHSISSANRPITSLQVSTEIQPSKMTSGHATTPAPPSPEHTVMLLNIFRDMSLP